MRRTWIAAPLLLAMMAPSAGAPLAQDLFVYPTKGQSQEQQEQDKFACYQWARDQSGFDPMQAPTASAPPPKDTSRSTGTSILGGAGIGAALGAIGGAIGGSAGKGAAIGAAGGGLLGGLHSTSQKNSYEKEHKQWEKEQTAQYQQGRNNYNRAYSGCMTGRGYTIS